LFVCCLYVCCFLFVCLFAVCLFLFVYNLLLFTYLGRGLVVPRDLENCNCSCVVLAVKKIYLFIYR
jgi:hypothetical protein